MMKSVALSESSSCLYATGDEDFVIVQAIEPFYDHQYHQMQMRQLHGSYKNCCLDDDDENDDNDDDDTSYDYCEDALFVDSSTSSLQMQAEAAHEVPFLVEDKRSDYSAFKSILIDSTSMTSSFFLAEMVAPSIMDALRSADDDKQQERAAAASLPASRLVLTTKALAVESVPTGENDDQSSFAERHASDSPKSFYCSDAASVSSQTEPGSSTSIRTSTKQEAFSLVAVAVDNDHGGKESIGNEPLMPTDSEDEERSSGLASTDADRDSDVTSGCSTTTSTCTVDGSHVATTTRSATATTDVAAAIDGTPVSTMKFKRLCNKKRRRQQKLARKAAAAAAAASSTSTPATVSNIHQATMTNTTNAICSKHSADEQYSNALRSYANQ
jgi:hypothetical protein